MYPIAMTVVFIAMATAYDSGTTNVYRVTPGLIGTSDIQIVAVNMPPESKQGLYIVIGR